jgi:hypothetical protein
MGLLDWVKRRGRNNKPEPENEPSEALGYTRKGNPIDLVHSGDWQSEMGLRETRVHLGKSAEGFHGGFQDVAAGRDGAIRWSAPQTDVEEGWRAAYGMYDRWVKDNAQSSLDVENNAIAESARKSARQTQADSKEPGGGDEPKPSRTHSIFSDYPDRVLKTEADVKKDDALLDMTLVVNEIANDPDTNWRKYKGEFEKAVTGMRDAFEPDMQPRQVETNRENQASDSPPVTALRRAAKQPGLPFERGDRIIADEPFYYGGKPKSNPDTPGLVDGVSNDGKRVSYHRLGSPEANTPIEHVRHAGAQDLEKYKDKFASLEAKVQQQSRGPSWDR